MSKEKQIYVTSGDVRVKVHCTGPRDAIKKALAAVGTRTIDSTFFYLDERGHRTDTARYKVPVEQALADAGYIFDDDVSSPSVED